MNRLVNMSVALAAGSVVGLLAERCTWQEPVDHGDAEQQGTIAILDKVNADLQESTPVALEQMLANTVDRMAAKDDRGAATIVLRWIASAAPEQLRELLETADFPEQLSRYRSAMRKTVLYRWAELEGEGDASRAWAVEKAEEGNQFAAWMPWLKSDREGALAKLRSEEHGDVLRAALNFLAATEEDFDLAGIIASGAEDLGAWVKIQMLRSVPVQQIIAAIEGIPDLDADQERSLVAGLVDGSELTPASLSLILNTVTDPDLKSLAIDQIATVVDNCPEVEQPLALLKLLVDRHDPIVAVDAFETAHLNPHSTTLLQTDRGGHMGYFARDERGGLWRWMEYFVVQHVLHQVRGETYSCCSSQA